MILVFGGTTEGNKTISALSALNKPFVYSTKTEVKVELPLFAFYRYGPLNQETLRQFILENGIKQIINAAHPFAEELHHTIATVSHAIDIPVFRFERLYPQRIKSNFVHYINNYSEALTLINQTFSGRKGLVLTGVQSIPKLKKLWLNTICFFRIIDRESSIAIAKAANFPKEQLILEEPSSLTGGEPELIKLLGVQWILTKESGKSGALSKKIDAALQAKIPIVIIKRPSMPSSFIAFNAVNDLTNLLDENLQKININK